MTAMFARHLPRTAVMKPFDASRILDLDFRMAPGNDMANASKKGLRYGTPVTVTYTGANNGTYFDNAGVLQASGADEPRFDHGPVSGAPLGLLIEEARENVILDSEVISSAANWAGAAPVKAANVAVAPDGNTTADSLEDNSAGALESVVQTVTIANDASTWCFSIYIKKDSDETRFPEILLQLVDGTKQDIGFDLNTSTGASAVRFSTGTVNSGVINAGDYWRPWVTVTNNTSGNLTAQAQLYPAIGTTLGAFNVAAVGTTIYWGAQLEIGAFPSSYIATTAAAVTRTKDVPSIALSSIPGFNQSAGTIYVEGSFPYADAAVNALLTIDDGTTTDRLYIERDASENINFATVNSADTDGASDGAAVIAVDTTFKVAAAYADDDVIACVDGTLSAADTSAGLPTTDALTTLRIGDDSGTTEWNGHIVRLVYWPERLSNAELVAITA